MKLGIIIPIHNRPQYLKDTLAALQLSAIPKGTNIILVDDASTNEEIQPTLVDFCDKMKVGKISAAHLRNSTNLGVRGTIKRGIDMLINASLCDNILVLDSDVVVKPYAIARMLKLQAAHPGKMVSGINCTMVDPARAPRLRNPLISEHQGYSLKEAVAGQCLLFNKQQYAAWVLPALNKEGNWDHNASIASMANGQPVVVVVPSVAQHIGMRSAMGHNHQEPDRAYDYKFINLPDVTLFGIDSHNIAGIERAARISQQDIEFGAVNIITEDLFTKNGSNEQRRADYSRFMMKELTKHFTTSHVLTIHADGFVVNWKAWDNSWMQYDYIGGTWWYKDNMNVGNGGFSLRSKKLCDILTEYEFELFHPEDHHICRTYRAALEEIGIRFAPEEVANRFSIEAYRVPSPDNAYGGQFGFHSVHVDFANAGLGYMPLEKKKPALSPTMIQHHQSARTRIINGRVVKI